MNNRHTVLYYIGVVTFIFIAILVNNNVKAAPVRKCYEISITKENETNSGHTKIWGVVCEKE